MNKLIIVNYSFNLIFNIVFFLCIVVGVLFFYKCLLGYVGVGICLLLFENCDVGFCYIEDKFSLILG